MNNPGHDKMLQLAPVIARNRYSGGSMYRRRFLACMLGGIIAAVFCFIGGLILFGFPENLLENISYTMGNRLLLGFAIALSAWRIHYLLHGAILGLLVYLSVSIGDLPDNIFHFIVYTTVGMAYGVFIEWLSTYAFKAPMKTS